MKKYLSIVAVVLGALTLVLFQNCAGNAFSTQDLVSIECSSSGCQESLREGAGGSSIVYTQDQGSSTLPSGGSGGPSTPVEEEETTSVDQDSSQLFNFVSGMGKSSCEDLIKTHKGVQGSCSMGGGCGTTCGKPGANCASANPGHYGACYSQNDLDNLPTVASGSSSLFNFVAGSKATCEKSIKDTHGKTGSCSVGGGCGVSCGKPGSSCPSANPSLYGACYSQNDIAALPAAVSAQLYNFVAGDKATCEQSIQNRLGLTKSCTKGGGCGLSCGKPSSSCVSANPQHFGACILY